MDLRSGPKVHLETDCYRDWMRELHFEAGGGPGGEIFLFHGTKPAIVEAVLKEPSAAFTAMAAIGMLGGFFSHDPGQGLYFGENASKCDEYSAGNAVVLTMQK